MTVSLPVSVIVLVTWSYTLPVLSLIVSVRVCAVVVTMPRAFLLVAVALSVKDFMTVFVVAFLEPEEPVVVVVALPEPLEDPAESPPPRLYCSANLALYCFQ